MREEAVSKLDKKLEDIKEQSDNTLEEIQAITTKIDEDRKERQREESEEEYKAKLEADELAEKMAMDDAARFI